MPEGARGFGSGGAVMGSFETPDGYWEPNPDPPEEEQVTWN